MNSTTIKQGPQSKPGQSGFPAVAPSSHAILLDKLNRRSTPDSEAMASSDDEPDVHRQDPLSHASQHQKPVRRASWLNDTSPAPPRPRKESFASSTMSPTASHPSTPSVEPGSAGPWGSHVGASNVLGRGHGAPNAFPWGTGIWNTERKEPPSRLSEVLPSPTSSMPPGGSFGGDATQASPASKDQPNPQIPFAIPLHPTPKTYRSQSYSVGQLEPDLATAALGSSAVLGGRNRPLPHSGLHHRPSRPSMLSEMANDGTMLGKVNEDEDDETVGPMQSSPHRLTDAKTIEMLTRENAYLRQQQYQNVRIRPRASTGTGYGYMQETVPEESDYAVDELDEANDASDPSGRRMPSARRMSEFGMGGNYRSPFMAENRKLENVKKAFWQSSPGHPLGDFPQSRRHSFADVPAPARQASISSIGDALGPHDMGSQDMAHLQDYGVGYADTQAMPSYFTGSAGLMQGQAALAQSTYGGNQYPSPYPNIHAPYAGRPPSPHRNMYGMSQPRHNQSLHIVLFKCARADVFYIQEGTGLTVKPGDLVIVEADRGTDLGTVAKDNVDWQAAKELKEHYAEEQYKWLMMYSQNAAAAQDGAGAGLMAASNGMQASAVGGMGPAGQHHLQEPSSGELKPKLIKRLAQSHEIHALRDKEGNEAKAKRVCMQKVKEHGLSMEILDAEFQMDWKKLTFYYFADSYINFNSLVTDLFKIYKTRIWMSAINPASFASPTLGLQAPSGIGPGAVGFGRSTSATDRRQNQPVEAQPVYAGNTSQTPRTAQSAFAPPFNPDRATAQASGFPAPAYPYHAYSGFGNVTRTAGYGSTIMPGMDGSVGAFGAAQAVGRFPSPSAASYDQGISPLAGQTDWVGSFQGLSLNTR